MRSMPILLTALAFALPMRGQAQETDTNTAFRVDSNASWIRVLAYPDGPLRRFGHHHVISHHGVSGNAVVTSNPLDSTITLELDVAGFEVDDADMRALEGKDFEKEVPQKDKDGTRANMLGERLLNAEQFPAIQVRSTAIEGSLPDVNVLATVTIIGLEQDVTFPAHIELTDDSFVASGQLELTHGDLGLAPFTAAGGALSVRDLMVFKYEIAGTRVTDPE